MAASEVLFKSVAELAPLLKARKLSPVELVRAFLDRIEALNPKVNAFITVTGEQALEQRSRGRHLDRLVDGADRQFHIQNDDTVDVHSHAGCLGLPKSDFFGSDAVIAYRQVRDVINTITPVLV